MNGQSDGLDVRISSYIRVSNANEHGKAVKEEIILLVGSFGVERLSVRKDAPKRGFGQNVESGRKASGEKSF